MQEINLILRLVLGAIFLTSTVGKIRATSGFIQSIQQYGFGLLTPRLVRITARLLPSCEFALAVLLMVGVWSRVIGLLTVGLLIVFTIPMSIHLAQGNRFPCHCFGQTGSTIGVGVLTRNTLLIVLAFVLVIISPWTVSGNLLFYLDPKTFSGTEIVAFLVAGTGLYLVLLFLGKVDTLLHALKG